MTKLKEFFNKTSNNNRIFTAEDIGEMSGEEFAQQEKAIDYQMETLGIPYRRDLAGNSDVVYVHEYTRSDGTKVKAHYRSKSGSAFGGAFAQDNPSVIFDESPKYPNGWEGVNYFGSGDSEGGGSIFSVLLSTIAEKIKSIFGDSISDEDAQTMAGIMTGGAAGGDWDGVFTDPQGYNKANVGVESSGNSAAEVVGTKAAQLVNYTYQYPKDYNNRVNINRPDARELMDISLSGFKDLPANREYSVFKPESAEYVNNMLNLNDSKGLKIPENWHGVVYNHNSGFSQRLSNSPELREQVRQQLDPKTNTFKNNQVNIGFSQDKNLNYSIGHGTILNPRIDDQGNFTGILFDKYDFELHWKSYKNDYNGILYNNMAWAMQNRITKHITNYYVIVPIKFKMRGK